MQRETTLAAITGVAGVGAGLICLLDPDRDGRRRALVRDHLVHSANEATDVLRSA